MDLNTQKLYVVMHEEKLQAAANRRRNNSARRSPGFFARLFGKKTSRNETPGTLVPRTQGGAW